MILMTTFQKFMLIMLFTYVVKQNEKSEIKTNITANLSTTIQPLLAVKPKYVLNQFTLLYKHGFREKKCDYEENLSSLNNTRGCNVSSVQRFMRKLTTVKVQNSTCLGKRKLLNSTVSDDVSTIATRVESYQGDIEFDPKARSDAYKLGKPEDSPYAVLLNMYINQKKIGSCSGTLLTPYWVLTAGHCLQTAKGRVTEVIVYAGGNSEDELTTGTVAPGSQTRKSTKIHPHPKYGSRQNLMGNDVGLLKVETPFQITKTVDIIKLASKQWTYHSYKQCQFTGYGIVQHVKIWDADNGKRKTQELRLKRPCVCQFKLRVLNGRSVANTYVCSEPKQDYGVCQGDSGGGVVCDNELRAVVSHMLSVNPKKHCDIDFLAEPQCGSQYSIDVFMNTCPFLRWINSLAELYQESDIDETCLNWKDSGVLPLMPLNFLILVMVVVSCILHKFTNTTLSL